jgi:hypothetical protein
MKNPPRTFRTGRIDKSFVITYNKQKIDLEASRLLTHTIFVMVFTLNTFERAFLLSLACDQYKSSTAPLLALDALKANLACTPRV